MRKFLRNLFSNRKEEVKPEKAAEFYRKERKDEMEEAEKKAEKLMDETHEILEELDSALEELKDYEDEKGRQVIEDVADNLHAKRRRMIEKLELPSNVEEHVQELEEFSNEFDDVSFKESQVLEYIDTDDGDLPGTIQRLVKHTEKMQDFLEEDYSAVTGYEKMRELVEELEEKKSRLEQLRDEVEKDSLEELRSEKEKKQEELDEILNGQEMREKNDREEDIQRLEKDVKEIRSELSRQVSKIDRSLKKILYQVENDEVGFEADADKLRKLEKQKFSEVEDVEDALAEAERIVEEEDLVDSSQEKKFREAASELSQLEERKEEIEQVESGIERLEEELDKMDVEERKEEKEKEIKRIEDEIEERMQLQEEREQGVEQLQEEISELEEMILRELDERLDVQVEPVERG